MDELPPMDLFEALFGPGWVVCFQCRGVVRAVFAPSMKRISLCARCSRRSLKGDVEGSLTMCVEGSEGGLTTCRAKGARTKVKV